MTEPRAISGKRHFAAAAAAEEESDDDEGLILGRGHIRRKHVVPPARTSENVGVSSRAVQISNLPPDFTEPQLRELLQGFAGIEKLSLLQSVTVRGVRKGAGAIAVFSEPNEAGRAKNAFDGRYIAQGWRTTACYARPSALQPGATTAPSVKDENSPFGARIAAPASYSRVPPTSTGSRVQSMQVVVQEPQTIQRARLIHQVISLVLEFGPIAEASLMARTKDDPQFEFLFNNQSRDHVYYRWKLYSLLHGDTRHVWRVAPFEMFSDGIRWVPPPLPLSDDAEEEDAGESEMHSRKSTTLSVRAREHLEWLLRGVSTRRGSIARAMAFAIRMANAAEEVVDIVVASIMSAQPQRKIWRLWVLNDILHNASSGMPNVWRFRQIIEQHLERIFSHFGDVHRSFEGRIKAEQLKTQVLAVLALWHDRIIFPEEMIASLRGQLEPRQMNVEPGAEDTSKAPIELQKPSSGFIKAGWQAVGLGNDENLVESMEGEEPAASAVESSGTDSDLDGEPLIFSEDELEMPTPNGSDEPGQERKTMPAIGSIKFSIKKS